MFPVILNSTNEGHSFDSFYEKFLAICKEHRDTNRALAFAFILYDFEHPQISKILKDEDYWLGLNSLSGQYLTVFSLHYKPKESIKPQSSTRMFQYMTGIRSYTNPSESSNALIEKYFGSDIQIKYPAVLFFQVHEDNIIDYSLIELDEQEIEPAFIELKEYIAKAVETLKQISNDNRQNSKEIFSLVSSQVQAVRGKKIIKRGIQKITSLTELGSSIIGLGG
jgi:hypothetical protein